jgi:hypothetical protein
MMRFNAATGQMEDDGVPDPTAALRAAGALPPARQGPVGLMPPAAPAAPPGLDLPLSPLAPGASAAPAPGLPPVPGFPGAAPLSPVPPGPTEMTREGTRSSWSRTRDIVSP